MRVLLLTNEYPPNIYGGAGVHVEHLTRELTGLEAWTHQLQVLCFGDRNNTPRASGVAALAGAGPEFNAGHHPKLLDALYRNLAMIGAAPTTDLIHCHTWYSYLAGCLLKQMQRVPLLITVHSLEPHRPWKREQLGEGYQATCWLERTALQSADGVIAVSKAMRRDLLELYGLDPLKVQVIYNGIDVRRFKKTQQPDILQKHGIDPSQPYILFVGRITHQKGILHLVKALPMVEKGLQVVLCAGAPDTPEIGEAMNGRVREARQLTANKIVWIEEMVPVPELVVLYSGAMLFVCPSVYEPFGIINLEAMACGTPVVAASVGGIPEVVVDGETGLLVPFEAVGRDNAEPRDPRQYALDLARAINTLLKSPEKLASMSRKARKHVEDRFGWHSIAQQTLQYYETLIGRPDAKPPC